MMHQRIAVACSSLLHPGRSSHSHTIIGETNGIQMILLRQRMVAIPPKSQAKLPMLAHRSRARQLSAAAQRCMSQANTIVIGPKKRVKRYRPRSMHMRTNLLRGMPKTSAVVFCFTCLSPFPCFCVRRPCYSLYLSSRMTMRARCSSVSKRSRRAATTAR